MTVSRAGQPGRKVLKEHMASVITDTRKLAGNIVLMGSLHEGGPKHVPRQVLRPLFEENIRYAIVPFVCDDGHEVIAVHNVMTGMVDFVPSSFRGDISRRCGSSVLLHRVEVARPRLAPDIGLHADFAHEDKVAGLEVEVAMVPLELLSQFQGEATLENVVADDSEVGGHGWR